MSRQRSVFAVLGLILVLAVGVVFSYITSSYAGFEWVPAAPVTPTPVEEIQKKPLETDGSSIDIEPALPLPEKDVEKEEEILQPVHRKSVVPVRHMPVENQAPAMKTLQIQRPEEQLETSEPTKDTVHWIQEERVEKPQTSPLPPLEPEVVQQETEAATSPAMSAPKAQTTIMLPEDAPESALNQIGLKENTAAGTPKSGLVINPFADKDFVEEVPVRPANADSVEETSYEAAIGFGSDTPLAFALRQIIPEDYTFSFGRHVNPGTLVSWSGGKPWNEVVLAMISPLGLELSIEEKNVFIYSTDQGALVPPASSNTESSAPVSLADGTPSLSSKRMNITSPSESISAQPKETMIKIDRLANAEEILQRTEPAGGETSSTEQPEKAPYGIIQSWEGTAGDSAKSVIEDWSQQANVELHWKAPHDFTLAHDIAINDRFDVALKNLVTEDLQDSSAPEISLFETPEGPKSARLVIR